MHGIGIGPTLNTIRWANTKFLHWANVRPNALVPFPKIHWSYARNYKRGQCNVSTLDQCLPNVIWLGGQEWSRVNISTSSRPIFIEFDSIYSTRNAPTK